MRAQDANRRRPPSLDAPRDTMSPKPFSVDSPRHSLTSSPSLPVRNIIQSASVCDLSAPNTWNPEIHQVRIFCWKENINQFIIKTEISFLGTIVSTFRSSNDLVSDR